MKKIYCLFLASILPAAAAFAIPAKKGTRIVTQPDGTSLTIRVVGDEFYHLTTTEDGAIIRLDDDGYFKAAIVEEDGAVRATEHRITTPEGRAAAMNISQVSISDLRTRSNGKRKAPQSGYGKSSTSYPTKGSTKGLVILVEYTDVKFHTADEYKECDAKTYFNEMINGENFTYASGTGSALEYFTEQSGGQFTPDFDVLGPVTLPRQMAYYGKNDPYGDDVYAHLMVSHAIEILDPEVDFSVYDTDKDGVIDNVYVFYAGQGEADYGIADTVWPHSWSLVAAGINKKVDGVLIDLYACSNEWEQTRPCGVGTFIHEFSHVMGLPDLYHTTSYNASYTPDAYSVLDYGPYNNNGRTPPNYSAYEKNALGWFEPLILDKAMTVTLDNISTGEFALIPTSKDTEFFLLENRQKMGWDRYIPNHGMLIWHIDYVKSVFDNNTVNNKQTHQYVDIVEANNKANSNNQTTLKGYTYPGTSGNTSFTATSIPALEDWDRNPIDVPITNITESNYLITFDVKGGGEQVSASVESLPENEDVAPVYFTLQGMKVDHPAKGTIVIEVKGTKTRKVKF